MTIDDAHTTARMGIDNLVIRVLRDHHGDDALTRRPIWAGASTEETAPADYRQGIQAARMVAGAANQLVDEYARKARAEGVPWRDLAEPLGVANGDGDDADPAIAAFQLIAGTPSIRFDPVSVGWDCASCGKRITDRGPFETHPDDNEHGHAEDCARHLAAIQAHEARWNDE